LEKETAVHMASRNNHVETVQLLIARNANIEARSYLGRTALHMTAQYGCEATAKLLLDHGANIEAQDLDNKTAIHIASWINHDETARLLIANNANIGAQSDLERLARAEISYGDEDISYYTYYSTNREERDCFISAAKNLVAAVKGDSAMVKFLLDCGANIEARDSQQQTALHLAASVGHDTTVWLLRIRGANIDSKDRHNKTPKDLAKEKAYTLTAQLLPSQLPSQSQLSQPPSWQSRRVRPHPAYDPVVSTRTKKSQGC